MAHQAARHFVACLVVCIASACSGSEFGLDAGPDATPDVGPGATSSAGPSATPDANSNAIRDAGHRATADASPDPTHDAGPRATPDAGPVIGPTGTRWVEVALVCDGRWMARFPDLATAKKKAFEILSVADGYFRDAGFSPDVRLHLTDFVAFTQNDPYTVALAPSGDVVSEGVLKDTFGAWAIEHLPQADVRFLLTGYRTNAALGMSNLTSVCTNKGFGFVRLARDPADDDFITESASVLAHEIGHTLGLTHDGIPPAATSLAGTYLTYIDTTACSPLSFIMSSTNFKGTAFSPCSQIQMAIALTLGYPVMTGGYSAPPHCLNNVPIDCTDTADAECDPEQPCCTLGCKVVRSTETLVCRRRRDTTCDTPETCDGHSAGCPSDVVAPSSTRCIDSTAGSGLCYAGQCSSYAQSCAAFSTLAAGNYVPCPKLQEAEPCGRLFCIGEISGECLAMTGPKGSVIRVAEGVPCGPSKRCLNGACVP